MTVGLSVCVGVGVVETGIVLMFIADVIDTDTEEVADTRSDCTEGEGDTGGKDTKLELEGDIEILGVLLVTMSDDDGDGSCVLLNEGLML